MAEGADWEGDDVRRRAQDGDAEAQYEMGVRYLKASNDKVDPEGCWTRAQNWLEAAAHQEHTPSMQVLGYALATGSHQHAPDFAKGSFWLNKAITAGSSEAMCDLAFCYLSGKGVAPSSTQAEALFRQAADPPHSNPRAQWNMGMICLYTSSPRREREGKEWLQLAAAQSDSKDYEDAIVTLSGPDLCGEGWSYSTAALYGVLGSALAAGGYFLYRSLASRRR